MPNPIGNITNKINLNRPLNVICYSAHERFEPSLAMTGHNFYCLSGEHVKPWNTKYSPIPENYHILKDNKLPLHLDFDLMIAHNPYVHLPLTQKLQAQLALPILNIMHTLPNPGWNRDAFLQHKPLFDIADKHIFISEFNRDVWGFENKEKVIHHGLDINFFKPDGNKQRKAHILTVANDYANRDWCLGFRLYQAITQNLPTRPVGDTAGLSKPANNMIELLNEYQTSSVFLNTSLHSPIPMSVIEAMACGCAVVSTNTAMLPDIIEHGIDGFLYTPNKPEKAIGYIKDLLNNPDKAFNIGVKAREKAQNMFSLERFTNEYNEVIYDVVRNFRPYSR